MLLCPPRLGYIGKAHYGSNQRAVFEHRSHAVFDWKAGLVLSPDDFVVNMTGTAMLVGGEHRTLFFGILAAVRPMVVEGCVRWPSEKFLLHETEHLACRWI